MEMTPTSATACLATQDLNVKTTLMNASEMIASMELTAQIW